ncbi:MAG: prepilin-type N-terminal cleavage/methylation domain-containing protein [Elusimicrobiota bacterium]
MPQLPRRRRPLVRLGGGVRAGYTLVEVMIAMLISAVMVTAVMGAAMTASQSGGTAMHKLLFNQVTAQLSAQVKGYVTACGCLKSTGFCPSPQCADPGINGPNTANAGAAQWYMNGADGNIIDSASAPNNGVAGAPQDVWALSCGTHHFITHNPPTTLEAPPYDGYVEYWVTFPGGCTPNIPANTDAPSISFQASWVEP